MEERTNSSTIDFFGTVRIKNKYKLDEYEFIRYNSCGNLVNFVPKITPKKSFCRPSLLVLNPDRNSNELEKKQISFESDSDENSLDLALKYSKDEVNQKLSKQKLIKNEDESKNSDLENKIELNSDNNKYNKYDSGEYVTILDILSMNHK